MMPVKEHQALRLAAAHYRWPAVRESHALEQLGMTSEPLLAVRRSAARAA